MNFFNIVYITLMISLLICFLKKRSNSNEHDNDIEFLSVSKAIDEINLTKEQLHSIEEMITEISICSPDEHNKVIRCEWANVSGEQHKYDLYLDGSDLLSDEMLTIAYSERTRLRSLLCTQIQKLNDRCNENCNENDHFSTVGEG